MNKIEKKIRSYPVNKLEETRKKPVGRLQRIKQHNLNLQSLIICSNWLPPRHFKNRFLSLITGAKVLLLSIALVCLWAPFSLAQIQFEEVTQAAGIFRWIESYGASWGNFNGDDWPDLWVGNHCKKPALYLNNSDGTFTDVNDLVKHYKGFEQHGAAWADFDNDGDQDLIQIVGGAVERGEHPNQFFVNSEGLLVNQAADYGLEYPLGRGRTPLWLDWNSDGYLDVFVTNLVRSKGEKASSALFTQQVDYFRNDTGSTVETDLSSLFAQLFVPAFLASPAIVIQGYPYPKRDSYPKKIYQYDKLSFRDITDSIGFPITNNVFDAVIADFNNDLLNDFFLVTMPEHSDGRVKDRLLIQTEEGFQDITAAAGLDMPTRCRSVAAADFDNDMDIDLYLVCTSIWCNIPNILYENMGDGTFQTVAAAGGAKGSSYGRGDIVATADYDNDGFVDLFVTNQNGLDHEVAHNQLFRNVGNLNHWIEIELQGVVSNRDGIGALLMASTKGMTQMRVQGGGIHRISQDHQRIHFGLAKNTLIEKLTIQWPSGIVQEIINITADKIVKVVELDFTGALTSGTPPLKVNFTSNTKGHYRPNIYEWDFDNNGTIDSNEQNPSYTYNNPGIYTVKLIVKEFDGSMYKSIRKDYIKLLNAEED